MMKGKPLSEISQVIGQRISSEFLVGGFAIDSRKVKEGDLFFAISGQKVDGHDYLKSVSEKKAVGAVVHKGYQGDDFGLSLIFVESVEKALWYLAKKSLEGVSERVIAITGSCGKTTTKDFLATILQGHFRVGKTLGSENSKLTLPLTVLNREKDLDFLILEMGMGEKGDIARLVEIAPPFIAAITCVGLAHAAAFPLGLSEIALAKAEIFSHPKTSRGFIDFEAAKFISDFKYPFPVETFSLNNPNADISSLPLTPPFLESHILHNLLLCFAIARSLGMDEEKIKEQIRFLKLPNMRCETMEKKGFTIVCDAYNANPLSMKAALVNMARFSCKGRKIAAIGSMKELGSFCESSHREMGALAAETLDFLLCFGEETKPMKEAFLQIKQGAYYFLDKNEMSRFLQSFMQPKDILLIKGSRSMEMETILDDL